MNECLMPNRHPTNTTAGRRMGQREKKEKERKLLVFHSNTHDSTTTLPGSLVFASVTLSAQPFFIEESAKLPSSPHSLADSRTLLL